MDLQRLAQQFKSAPAPVRARFGSVVQVNADYTVDVLVGGMVTDAEAEAAFSSGFVPMGASGGTLGTVTVGDIEYRTHTFTTAGTFVVGTAGVSAELECLFVAGGGGGGGASSGNGAGGGGAGRVVELTLTPTVGTATFSVGSGGAGGAATPAAGSDGGNTTVTLFGGELVVATGGGGGGRGAGSSTAGRPGGSGGGGGGDGGAGGTAVAGVGYGNAGGRTRNSETGGGGGGALSSGLDASRTVAGNGGQPVSAAFEPISGTYGGGGGGGSDDGTAGVGGGDAGDGGADAVGQNAAGYGNGGGGGSNNRAGGNGSAGVVIFSYRITPADISNDVIELGDEVISDQVSGIKFLGRGVPIPGQTVLLLTDGADLLALDSLAQAGSTISPRRYRTTAQSIPDNTETVVTWGTAVANDLLGMAGPSGGTAWDNRLYAHIPGWYQAAGAAEWGSDADGWRRATIRFNGTAVLAAQQADTDATGAFWQQVSTPTFYMSAGDFVDMTVQHTAGNALDLAYENEFVPSLSLTFLGP